MCECKIRENQMNKIPKDIEACQWNSIKDLVFKVKMFQYKKV